MKKNELTVKKQNLEVLRYGLGMAGNVSGLIYAYKTKRKFWGYVGFFLLGGAIIGIPTFLAIQPKINKLNAQIKEL